MINRYLVKLIPDFIAPRIFAIFNFLAERYILFLYIINIFLTTISKMNQAHDEQRSPDLTRGLLSQNNWEPRCENTSTTVRFFSITIL